jgi:hypothetical protein
VKASIGVVEDGDTIAPLPRVPFSNVQRHEWSYNASVASVTSYAVKDTSSKITGGGGTVVDKSNWEKVPATPGSPAVEYHPSRGLTDQRALLAAQAAADSVLQAHPYSGPRTTVQTHG